MYSKLHGMSEDQLKAFLEAVQANAGLQQKIKAATEPEELAVIAKEAGFVIAAGDLKRMQTEISDQALEGVAGGTAANTYCYDTAQCVG